MIQILILVCAFFIGAYVGWDYRDSKVAQEVAKAQAEAIAEHNETALIDMEAAREAGQRESKARTVFVEIAGKAAEATAAAPAPAVCDLDDKRWGVLNDAINAANSKGAAQPVPNAKPTTEPASKPQR